MDGEISTASQPETPSELRHIPAGEGRHDQQIIAMRERGMGQREIALAIGWSANTVNNRVSVLRKAGLTIDGRVCKPGPNPAPRESFFRPVAPRLVETPPPRKCQWPLWGHHERPSHLYCNAPNVPGRSWCAEHCARAYTRAGAVEPVSRPANKSAPLPPRALDDDEAQPRRTARGAHRRGPRGDRAPVPIECCVDDLEREIAHDWAKGLTAAQIGVRQGKAEGTIGSIISRIRGRQPGEAAKRRGNPMFGAGEARTEIPIPFSAGEELTKILRLYNEGRAYSEIAAIVGTDKNRVAGLIYRSRPGYKYRRAA